MSDYRPDLRERGGGGRLTSAFQEPSPDTLPPNSLEAEMSCLGGMIQDNSKIEAVLKIVRPEEFWRDAHQLICRRIEHLHLSGKPIDNVSLADDLRKLGLYDQIGGFDAIIEIIECVPHAANVEYYAHIVKEKAKARLAIELANDIIRRAYGMQETADDVLDRAVTMIESVRSDKPEEDPASFNPLPEKMDAKAFRGIAGDIVNIIAPHTESCVEAILGQFLVAFGSVCGPRPHWRLEATAHRCNLFLCLVGPTGIAQGNVLGRGPVADQPVR